MQARIVEDAVRVVIDALRELGLREECFVLAGGGPLTQGSALAAGADGYCGDSSTALDTAKALMEARPYRRMSGALLRAH